MDQHHDSARGSQSTGAPRSGFHQAATFVERALSFRSKPAGSTGPPQHTAHPSSSSTQNLRAIAPLTQEDLSGDIFPRISDHLLEKLLPGSELQDARTCVKASLEEMHLNYDLDPKLLGERSEVNKGNRLIALLLSKMSIADPKDTQEEGSDAHLSGQVPDEGGDESSADANNASSARTTRTVAPPRRSFETHDLLKAIDQKDMETILAVRDANFDLLLDLSQGGTTAKSSTASSQAGGSSNTPLGYAISLGKGWESISIVLVGALSKFVNTLPDDEDEFLPPQPGQPKTKKPKKLQLDPRTMQRLRKIRVNLKLAIDHSIYQDQNSLLASYLQVLVMSEGSPFMLNAVEDVQHCLIAKMGDPVAQARSQVMQFVTDSLKHKQDKIAAVKDYIANAQGDLLLMALWNTVRLPKSTLVQIGDQGSEVEDLGNPLPLYFFARDDRVTAHFVERVDKVKHIDAKPKHQALLKLATRTADALQQGTRRKNSNERLEIITAAFHHR